MVSTVDIQIATADDATKVTDVLKVSYQKLMKLAYNDDILRRALPAIARANSKLLDSGTYYVARHSSGLVVGCGGWTAEKPGTTEINPGVGHIRHFAVDPRWIRQGIGRQIYQACETQARSNNIVIFDVFSSLNARSFYASLGFDEIEEINVAVGSGITL